MDSSKKIKWNSTTLTNESEFGCSQASSRDNQHLRLNDGVNIQPDEVISKLKVLSEAVNETAAENNALGKEILQLLGSLDIQPQSLSRQVTQGLDKVSAILRRENLAEVNETTLVINMERRKREELMKAREERELKKKYEELCWQYSHVEDKLNAVQEKVNSLNDVIVSTRQDNENEYSDMIHKATKLNDYKQHCDTLEHELASMQVSDDYSDKLLDKYKQYMQANGELAVLNKSLSKYGDLPPDILQARAVLQQKEKRRQELKKLLDEKMG